jgi:UPF0271 protein
MILDLNADLGEGAGTDAELMKYITSANVCCGMHAGDPETIWKTLELAKKHGVVCGAHPGFADRENFGRKELPIDQHGAYTLCLHQLGAITALDAGSSIRYVKPHGALYHLANRNAGIAFGILEAGRWFRRMPFVGFPDSTAEKVAVEHKTEFIREGFADRRYLPDGTLVPRSEPNAVIHDAKEVVDQVEWVVKGKKVRTICVHGDTPGAVEFVRTVRGYLLDRGHTIRAFAES